MKIVLKDAGHGWFTVVRAEHDGREWFEQTGPNSARFMCSERLSPEACVEGSADEMLAIAHAIKDYRAVKFDRCAVHVDGGFAYFHSPRNSKHATGVPIRDALEFADQVIRKFEV